MLIALLRNTATSVPLPFLKALNGQQFIAPFYHSISNRPLAHIKHLYEVRNAVVFKKDLEFLLRHYKPIDLSSLLDYYNEHQQLPKNRFWLSFDDGLAECATVVAPILKSMGIPATFFLNSAFIDNQALMFRYKASLIIEHLNQSPSTIHACKALLLQNGLSWSSAKESLLQIRWPQQALLNQLMQYCSIDESSFLQTEQPYLTSTQIRSMQADGFTFGSHSIDHPRYNLLPLEAQLEQTIKGHKRLEQHFNFKHRVFAFPFTDFGVSNRFFEQLQQQMPFDFTFGGAGMKQEQIQRQLQRFPMETQQKHAAKQLIHAEHLYYCIKAVLKKNTLIR